MKNKKLIRFVESFILLPILTISSQMPAGSISQAVVNIVNTPSVVSQEKQNISISDFLALNDVKNQKIEDQKIKAEAIDAYFGEHDMPLEGMGMKMVEEAEKNDLDWRLLAAIAVRESTGGKFECKKVENNAFGWGSCKIGFKSNEEAIEIVAKNLGGNNPNTARHYEDKTTKQILRAYNPPSIVPRYAEQVISIMNTIGSVDEEVVTTAKVA
ncbi:MAG: hypothetical protein UR90_C0003G0016 [Parcubacteria group bacterium GW2011_GWC1_35_8]|uniref:Mannosyl-glycoprotein endo-beta-N-acetylglucosamidase-like domain-containing protein n=2 Tax=Candidatus Nomuraibacteriota TaxID=1752729 RepID=A0A0G0G8F7_9BACT|nr:MAG: hypothetical protein UR90_C0003G0016 [Parcubacteria group bacterium GW2011_GWC1_35_8]KKP88007.1 MAG: hypothetical protein UR91_C0029G0003 [Candidatus Nomurabacteria bacterium GW2011_GWC2_35_8]